MKPSPNAMPTCDALSSRHEYRLRSAEAATVGRHCKLTARAQSDADLFLATLTVAEIWRGVLTAPIGRRQQELERWFLGPLGPQALFQGSHPGL